MVLQTSSSGPWRGSARHSWRMRRRLNWCSQAKVPSTTQRTVPSPEPCATPRRAIVGSTPRFHRRRRYLSKSWPRSALSAAACFGDDLALGLERLRNGGTASDKGRSRVASWRFRR